MHNLRGGGAQSDTGEGEITVTILKTAIILITVSLMTGCAAVPFGIGMIPGAPAYFSSIVGNGQTAYETAMDERSTRQQMLDAIIAGHAQAEIYKNKEIRTKQITAHCYFGKLYLVGEYESQDQLRTIYACMNKVEGKRAIISLLYLKEKEPEKNFLERQAMYSELRAQLMADFEVTSSPVDVEIVQGDIILLGVISDKEERDLILAHAQATHGVNRVVSYLYHSEKCGPKPRIMTAGKKKKTTPKTNSFSASLNKRRSKKAPTPSIIEEKQSAVLVLRNPDRGR